VGVWLGGVETGRRISRGGSVIGGMEEFENVEVTEYERLSSEGNVPPGGFGSILSKNKRSVDLRSGFGALGTKSFVEMLWEGEETTISSSLPLSVRESVIPLSAMPSHVQSRFSVRRIRIIQRRARSFLEEKVMLDWSGLMV
jgi:hypothetical protein